jgi:hypothetical protein
MSDDRWTDRGTDHRRRVLSHVAKLWEAHPDHSFCELVDRFVISIGSMAGHTTDEEVIDRAKEDST